MQELWRSRNYPRPRVRLTVVRHSDLARPFHFHPGQAPSVAACGNVWEGGEGDNFPSRAHQNKNSSIHQWEGQGGDALRTSETLLAIVFVEREIVLKPNPVPDSNLVDLS